MDIAIITQLIIIVQKMRVNPAQKHMGLEKKVCKFAEIWQIQ